MIFTRRKLPSNPLLTLGNGQLSFVKEFKFLGVFFDQRLTWSRHVDYLVSKCSKAINILKSVSSTKWGADKSSMILLYKALVQSRLDYDCLVFMNAAQTH